MYCKFLKFLLLVNDFGPNKAQEHKEDTGYRFMFVSCSFLTWDSWLCIFSKVVGVSLHPCTPWAWLLLKQQTVMFVSLHNLHFVCFVSLLHKAMTPFCWEHFCAWVDTSSNTVVGWHQSQQFTCAIFFDFGNKISSATAVRVSKMMNHQHNLLQFSPKVSHLPLGMDIVLH